MTGLEEHLFYMLLEYCGGDYYELYNMIDTLLNQCKLELGILEESIKEEEQ